MTTTTTTVSELARTSIFLATTGATAFLKTREISLDLEDTVALNNAISVAVKDAIAEALADAKTAIDCGMIWVAEQTFAASMRLAGIAAAKIIATRVVEGKAFIESCRPE